MISGERERWTYRNFKYWSSFEIVIYDLLYKPLQRSVQSVCLLLSFEVLIGVVAKWCVSLVKMLLVLVGQT